MLTSMYKEYKIIYTFIYCFLLLSFNIIRKKVLLTLACCRKNDDLKMMGFEDIERVGISRVNYFLSHKT